MTLLEFFDKESSAPKVRIMFMAVLSGLTNAVLLSIINTAAAMASVNEVQARFFFLYLTAFVLLIYTRNYSLSQATIAIEAVIRQIRVRIANKIRNSELLFIENMGRGEMYTRLTKDTDVISESALILVSAGQAIILVIACFLYIAWLSPIAFLMISSVVLTGVFTYLSHYRKISAEFQHTVKKEAEFFESLSHVLNGFKEIKINHRKSDDLFSHVESISNETERLKVSVRLQSVVDLMFSQVFFYLLIATLIFVMPVFSATHSEMIFKITATVLFIIGPLQELVGSIPTFARASVAVHNVHELESQLDAIVTTSASGDIRQSIRIPTDLKEIRLETVTFHYSDAQGKPLFLVGPLNLTIKRGEILFIVGGNGSGKSTLLKLLTGLYYPTSGAIYLDDDSVDADNYASFRELFAVIFTDFHLFDRLYGLTDIDEQAVKQLLRLMELDKKTKYVGGKFTNLNLSTGQKKRLAFVATALENKLIYVFDELAADQDPAFRKYFYEVLLKDLVKQGKTIIAVTHDDHYFHTADRVLKMEYGQLVASDYLLPK